MTTTIQTPTAPGEARSPSGDWPQSDAEAFAYRWNNILDLHGDIFASHYWPVTENLSLAALVEMVETQVPNIAELHLPPFGMERAERRVLNLHLARLYVLAGAAAIEHAYAYDVAQRYAAVVAELPEGAGVGTPVFDAAYDASPEIVVPALRGYHWAKAQLAAGVAS